MAFVACSSLLDGKAACIFVSYFCDLYACGPLPLILFVWVPLCALHSPGQVPSLFSCVDPYITGFMLQAKLLQTPKQGQNPLPHKASLTPIPLLPAFQWNPPQKPLLCLQHRLLQQLQRQTLPVSPTWQICQNMANLLLKTLLLHPLRSGSWHVCNISAGDVQNLCNLEMRVAAQCQLMQHSIISMFLPLLS